MKSKIKIILIVSAIERSGPSLGLLALFKLLKKYPEKYEVKVISRFCRNFEIIDKDIIYTNNYFNTFLLLKNIKKKDEVFCLSYDIKMDLINVISGKNDFIYVRGNLLDNYSVIFGNFFGKILYFFHTTLLKKCFGILVLTKTQEKIFKNIKYSFGNKISLLPNFIDEVPKQNIKKKKNTFLIISSLIKRKRVFETLKSFIDVFNDNEDYSLTIIGDGIQHSKILSLKSNNYKCSVKIINESINPIEFLKESEYFILMSDSEGLSRASLEASYFNCKMILSNIDVHKEFFSEFALLVDSFKELKVQLNLIKKEKISLKTGYPELCNANNIEKTFNLILNKHNII